MTAPTAGTPAQARPDVRAPRRRPRTEYWDVSTASWRTRGPVVPAPRSGS